jgi:hypothetical protein
VTDFTQLLLAAVALAVLAGAAAVWLTASGHMEIKLRRRPEPRKQPAVRSEQERM